MASVLTSSPFQERAPHAAGLTIVEPSTTETPVQPRRLLHHMLVLEPTSLLTYECARAFRAASYAMRPVRTWEAAIDLVLTNDLDAALLDIDAIDANISSRNISAKRLVTLMHRAAQGKQMTIAAVSRRDYAEVEDTLRAGVDVFVNRHQSLLCLIQRIDATRVRNQRMAHIVAPVLG